jgi:tetratricopeptide (TPR) repeat protein
VHASSGYWFEQSYRRIAGLLKLPGWNDPDADMLQLVYVWLSDESHGEWKMIVDNADDADVILEPWDGRINADVTELNVATKSSNRPLSSYLPISPTGSIVITSRARGVVEGLDVFNEDIFHVGPMEPEMAKELLQKKLHNQAQVNANETILELVRHLDGVPLAITQAVAYINHRTPRVTLARYIEILETDDNERAKLLQKNIHDPRRDSEVPHSIIMTWHTTFKHLTEVSDSAARLLALMSMFDREAIPDYLLQGQYLDGSSESDDFEDDVAMLRDYSLINIGTNEHVFDMHQLVQFSTKTWLSTQGELTKWQARYIDILDEAFPNGDYASWSSCRPLFPHVEAMLSYHMADDQHRKAWAAVLYRGSRYALGIGLYGVAEEMGRTSLVTREATRGLDHPDTLDSMDHLGVVLQSRGKYEQAQKMNRQVLITSEKVLGLDHPNTLTSVNNLAGVLYQQGKYEQAEEMNRRVLVGRQRVLGGDYLVTLTSMNNLAVVLRCQRKYQQAEEMNRQALEGREKMLGMDHPDTLMSVANLAIDLQDQGKYEQAEDMNRRALVGMEKALGEDYPETLASVSGLAMALHHQRKYKQTEEMNRRALAGRETVLGEDHPDTLTTMTNLGMDLQD